MRENTRCEVDEPISTPTESTHSSSSSPKVRPVEEKKMGPPWASSWASSVMPTRQCKAASSFFREQPAVIALVIFRPHAVVGTFALHGLGVFLPQERILHVIGDRGAAFRNVHGRIIAVLLAGRAGFASGIVRPEPGGEAERLLGRAEMLVVPACAAGRRRYHADRLVI